MHSFVTVILIVAIVSVMACGAAEAQQASDTFEQVISRPDPELLKASNVAGGLSPQLGRLLKRPRLDKPGRANAAISTVDFVEVEIVLNDQFGLSDAYVLPRAPGNAPAILDGPGRVRVQIPAGKAAALIDSGLEAAVLRRFILFEGFADKNAVSKDGLTPCATCSGPYRYGESGFDADIPDDGSWAGSGMEITGAPAGAVVTCVDVCYEIQHYYWSWLYVEVSDSDYYFTHELFNDWYDGSGYIYTVKTGITTFNGRDVNQEWVLWAADGMYYGPGYIDYWWIKVYYSDSPYCSAGGGGCDEYISRLQVGTIDNSSSCSGYADYTGQATTMEIGTGYPVTVTNSTSSYPEDQCGIWVDWNQDEDFADSGEQITTSGGPGTFTATVTPPGGAVLGDTRMRIRIMYTGQLEPCGHTEYGEVEDYTITVTAASVPVSVSGYIKTAGEVGIPDVSVMVTNGGGTVLTGVDGYYQTTVLSPWTGSITPGKSLWSFEPGVIGYVDLTTDVTDADFTGTYTANPTPMISGYVKKAGGDGLRDVLVSADSGESDTTDSRGYYEFTVSSPGPVPEPWIGTVTPGRDYWEFDPAATFYANLSDDVADQDYTATYTGAPSPKISGYVKTNDGMGIRNVLVSSNHDGGVDITDVNGFYQIAVPGPWNGLVFARKKNWNFDPGYCTYSNVGADIADQNYTGSYACTEDGNGIKQKWVAVYNGPENDDDIPCAITADDLGNVYVTGKSFGSGYDYDYVTIKYGRDSNEPLWTVGYDFAGHDEPTDITVDDLGNVYVTGGSYGSVSGNQDYATIKYDPNGVELWVKRYNGTGDDYDEPSAITVDSLGNVYVTGGSDGAGTDRDALTIKYDANGVELWAKRYNGPADGYDAARDITVDSLGNVFITGHSDSAFTIKYDPDGDELWVAKYNCPENTGVGTDDIAVDDFGNVFVGGATDVNSDVVVTSFDYLVIKYDSQGNEIWVASYNGPGDALDIPVGMGIDGAGNVYISGQSTDNSTYSNYLTVKYNSDSNQPVWVSIYDGPQHSDYTEAMAVDVSGNVYVTGTSWGEGSPPLTLRDYVTVKYGPDSNEPLWIARYDRKGCGSDDYAECITVDERGDVYVTGQGPGSGTAEDFMTIKYSPCCRIADFDCSGIVDANDLAIFCEQWLWPVLTADFSPPEGDGLVDFYDWDLFAGAWQSSSSLPGWKPGYDIAPQGGDGIIDANDLAAFANQWLQPGAYSGDICPFPQGDGIVNICDFNVFAEHWFDDQ